MLHLKKKLNIILKKDSNVLLIFDVGHVATTIHKQVPFLHIFHVHTPRELSTKLDMLWKNVHSLPGCQW